MHKGPGKIFGRLALRARRAEASAKVAPLDPWGAAGPDP